MKYKPTPGKRFGNQVWKRSIPGLRKINEIKPHLVTVNSGIGRVYVDYRSKETIVADDLWAKDTVAKIKERCRELRNK
jgi:hypothetical protein